jgi:hypothetical protein
MGSNPGGGGVLVLKNVRVASPDVVAQVGQVNIIIEKVKRKPE